MFPPRLTKILPAPGKVPLTGLPLPNFLFILCPPHDLLPSEIPHFLPKISPRPSLCAVQIVVGEEEYLKAAAILQEIPLEGGRIYPIPFKVKVYVKVPAPLPSPSLPSPFFPIAFPLVSVPLISFKPNSL